MDMKKPVKVTFAEGCFDNFEGNQEELDELVAYDCDWRIFRKLSCN